MPQISNMHRTASPCTVLHCTAPDRYCTRYSTHVETTCLLLLLVLAHADALSSSPCCTPQCPRPAPQYLAVLWIYDTTPSLSPFTFHICPSASPYHSPLTSSSQHGNTVPYTAVSGGYVCVLPASLSGRARTLNVAIAGYISPVARQCKG
jgi:hypothetical protein